ncbi:MAG: methyltransferase domain-containing protein [Anaerolineae bacterium]|nr:methyltransferase domain-containing protein [Anaerolineae bacterium]
MLDLYEPFARFYDAAYERVTEDVPMYLGFAQRTGGPILELGCGTGRLMQPLAEAGYRVTGVDASPAMLALAEKKLAAASLSQTARLVNADMREFQTGETYRLAFIALNTFMHLETQADQLRALRCWRRHLAPGGFLTIDLFSPDLGSLLEADGRLAEANRWTDPATGVTVQKLYTRTVDLATQTISVTFVYDETLPDGTLRRALAPFKLRYLWRYEAELLLDKAGYVVEELYGSYYLEPFSSSSGRMIFVARRREGES